MEENTHQQENKPQSTRGGVRSILTWQEKLAQCVTENIRSFIAAKAHLPCDKCNKLCFVKIASLGEAGVHMIQNLRESRLAGKISMTRASNIFQRKGDVIWDREH